MDVTRQPEPDTPVEDVPSDTPLLKEDIVDSTTKPAVTFQDETSDDTVVALVNDVLYHYKHDSELYKTYFYKVMLDGNVTVLKKIIQYMESNKLEKQLSWLLRVGRKHCLWRKQYYQPISEKRRRQVMRWVIFIITALISIVINPVFYTVHAITSTMFNTKKRDLVLKSKLPLVFGALSQSSEVVEFLLQKGVRINSVDDHLNNVFHYISDYSNQSSQAACKAFNILVDEYANDSDAIENAIFKQKNSQGFTALEYVAKYGSPVLMSKFIAFGNYMTKTKFAVTQQRVSLANKKVQRISKAETESNASSLDFSCEKGFPVKKDYFLEDQIELDHFIKAKTKEQYVDITKYESMNIAELSLLLRLISSRSLNSMSVADMKLREKCPVIGKWIRLKIAEVGRYIWLVHCLDFSVTLVLFLLVGHFLSDTRYTIEDSKMYLQMHIGEIEARQNNRSNILVEDSYQRILRELILCDQLEWLSKLDNNQNISSNIDTIFNDNEINANNISAAVNKMDDVTLDEVWTHVAKVLEYLLGKQNKYPGLLAVSNIPKMLEEFSTTFFDKHSDIDVLKIDTKTFHKYERLIEDHFLEFSSNILGFNVKLNSLFNKKQWDAYFCLPIHDLSQVGFQTQVSMIPPQAIVSDICKWQSLVNMAEGGCSKYGTASSFYKQHKTVASIKERYSDFIWPLSIAMMVVSIIYIMIDTFEHLLFFYYCIRSCNSSLGMVMAVLTWRLPGSYCRKQLNVGTHYALILNVCIQSELVAGYVSDLVIYKVIQYLLLTGFICRCMMHIQSMRLLPWIGHFIIVTFMMGTNLIHFSTVLGVVIFIFGLIFHILLFDKDCPVYRYEDFENVGKSMFAVFKLTFGHGEFDPYYSSTPAMITYILYIIICCLLLLNLIIAIMSATATDVMAPESVEAISTMEWLYEALSVEYTLVALTRPFRLNWSYKRHKRAGYVITGHGEDAMVYIKVFYCSKLD